MPARLNPELMVVGDSLAQGCRSLSVTADFCAQSWPARLAAVQGWEFVTPDFPRPILFDLDDDIRRQLDLAALLRHRVPGFVSRFRQNLADWVRNVPASRFDSFDNVAVAGARILDLYQQTPASAQRALDARTAARTLLEQLSDEGLADIHNAINARFTLNPSQDAGSADVTQLEWVRARVPKRLIVQIGHNHGLYAIGSDATVARDGATGGNGGVGYFEQWTELARHLAELPPAVALIVVCLLPKVGAVANLRPKGSERADGYAPAYEPVFSISPNTLSGAELAAADKGVRAANTRIEEIVRSAAAARGNEGRLRFIDVYGLFEKFDFKNLGGDARRLSVPDRPTLDNLYLDRTLVLRNIAAGGFQSADGMHASGVGYALLASEVMDALGMTHDRGALLRRAFDEDLLLATKSPNLDALVGVLGSIRRTRIDLGFDLPEVLTGDQFPLSRIIKMAQSVFNR